MNDDLTPLRQEMALCRQNILDMENHIRLREEQGATPEELSAVAQELKEARTHLAALEGFFRNAGQ